ncbi:hypothetical protein [Devosia sp.]|jgi:hypothetical protein|uniref:hypothetical protein n=1 Tax=Devosia sp. TaxID=1871048 RepID=UPI0037C0D0D9
MTDPHQPLQTLAFTLTRADALAYELSRPLGGWRRWVLLIWLGLAGAWVAVLPEPWVEGWRFWVLGALAIGAHYLLATLALNLLARGRAARRVPTRLLTTLEIWGDYLTQQRGSDNLLVSLDAIAATSLTPTHLFIQVPPEVLILPRTAFKDPSGPEALAALIDAAGKE